MTIWKIIDSLGNTRTARFVGFSDFGGTDVSYHFRDVTDDSYHIVRGQHLKQSHPEYMEKK